MKFKALVVSEKEGFFSAEVAELSSDSLAQDFVKIKVEYSSLNYKDALSFSGNKGVTRQYPHVPGIDAAGVVVESHSSEISIGDDVLVTGYDLGMNTFGGFGEYISVPASWVVKRPSGFTARNAMEWGTAGLTAALCVEKLMPYISIGDTIAVSGSSGGVGGIAIQLLAKLGFNPIAITRTENNQDYLKSLGAIDLLLLDDLKGAVETRPMGKPRFAAAIDTIGGSVLDALLKQVGYQGAVACCGLVESPALNTNVLPFILRGVSLHGVDSVELPKEKKEAVWAKIANEWALHKMSESTLEIGLDDLADRLDLILAGNSVGHYLLKHDH